MKSIFSKKARPDPELLALKAELQEAQGELSLAYRRFDQAVDPELVESCVYEISAVKARCNYLIRTIKAREPNAAAAFGRAAGQCGTQTDTGTKGALPQDGAGQYSAYGDEEGNALWT